MRLLFLLLLSVSYLFSFAPIGEEIIYTLDIKKEKKAKEIFSFLKNYDFKKSFFEDWDINDKKSFFKYYYFDTEDLKLYKKGSEAVLIEKRDGKSKKEFNHITVLITNEGE